MYSKKTKLLSVLLAGILLLAAIAGCNNQDDANTPAPTPAGNETPTKTPDDVPKNDLRLTVWNAFAQDYVRPTEPEENLPNDWLIAKTGVQIEEMFGNGGEQWEAKLNALVAGGTLPHVMLTQAGEGVAHQAKLHEGDLNWELTPELLQTYAPDVWAGVPDYIWDAFRLDDGKIYGIPFALYVDLETDPNLDPLFVELNSVVKNTVCWGSDDNFFSVRDDILKMLIPEALDYEEAMALLARKGDRIADELALPIYTTEEFIKFMYDVKDLGLTVGNMPVYATGFNGGDNWIALSALGAQMLGYKGYFYTGYMDIPNKKMAFGYADPIFKEAGLAINRMIREEIIDPESLLHTPERFEEKILNGQYAVAALNWVQGLDVVNQKLAEAGKDFRYVPFHTQVPNRPEYPYYKEGPKMQHCALSFLKTLSEDELKQVLGWVNVQFTEEWDDVRSWGPPEAGLYTVNADGTRTFNDPNMQKFLVDGDTSAMDWKQAKGLCFNGTPYMGGSCGFFEGVTRWMFCSTYDPRVVNKIKNYTLQKASLPGVGSKFTNPDDFAKVPNVQSWSAEYANLPEVQELWSTRAAWDDPFKVALAMGSDAEFNAKWDECVENLKNTVALDTMLAKQTEIMLPLYEARNR